MELNLSGIIEVDLHGMRAEQAHAAIRQALSRANGGIYRIRCIHGYHGGTRIRDMIYEEYSYGREPEVKRIAPGSNAGVTELVLREY